MGIEAGGTSYDDPDDREDEEDDEYEEAVGPNRLLGFMFGNVDNSGDLDVDYLDEEAKEHLAAVADKLGPALTDIELSVKTPQTPFDAAEQDYDEKAEDAVDYEDIEEQYEGPEVQATTEEDFLLPRKEYFSKDITISSFGNNNSLYDDENYDEDEDLEQKDEVAAPSAEVKPVVSSGDVQGKKIDEEVVAGDAFHDELESEEELLETMGKVSFDSNTTALPVIHREDGVDILRFSEIFGLYKPLKKTGKKDRKYHVPREKLKISITEEIVEEDEEAFLKESCLNVGDVRVPQVIQDYVPAPINDDYLGSRQFGSMQVSGEIEEERTDSCRSSEPFGENLQPLIPADWNLPFRREFYLLDQQNWEDSIIWDNSPANVCSIAESCEMSGSDSDESGSHHNSLKSEPKSLMSNLETEHSEIDEPSIQFDFCISVEPFGSGSLSDSPELPGSLRTFHPQQLRLESRSSEDNPSIAEGKNGVSEDNLRNYSRRQFNRVMLQNRDLLEGSWLDNIIWDPDQAISDRKLIFDFQDEQMLFEIQDNKDGKHLRLHAGAMIITRSVKASSGDLLEQPGHGGPSGVRFNISNDKFYSNRKSSQQLKSHVKKRAAHGLKVFHSIPALKLQTMKPKLSNKDIANFHRPKALWYPHDNEAVLKEQEKLPTLGPMKIILRSLGGKGCKLHVDAEEMVSSVKAKASKKLDFKLSEPVKIFYSGAELEDDKTLAAQSVRPNSLLHLVRTKLHLLPRAQKLPGENKSLRPPGAFKKKSDLSVKDGHVFLMEYCEERPLLLGNAGMGARLCTYYQKSNPSDQTGNLMRNGNNGLGSVIVLDPADKSPFLGDIKPGCIQSSLETNMYRAPIYQHKVSSTDYLLVRTAKGKLSIRRIDRINVVGQQEPHMEVMSPGSKAVQTYIMNRLLVYMYREFVAAGKRVSRPSIRADELSAHFPSLTEAFLRKRLKHCADLQRGPNGQLFWMMRRNFRIPLEEELRRMVTPENVCAYESMQAGLYRLKRLGITRLTSPAGLSSAMNQLPDEAIALAAASHIERELQITPWNLSSNFVACTSQDRENIERLEITGVGDPSGRGLGFSFVRNTPKAPMSNAVVKKKAVIGKGTTVTGTDADLRRLSMEAAREVLLKFNVPDEQIDKQTRWHRIAMIRKLSSEQAASGVKVDQTTISKYARGQRMSFMQLQQQTREKCQEIWDRQVLSLSAVDGEENESDSEANSDLDSFAGDLENLLDAEEYEDGDVGNNVSKHDTVDGVKGLKMRRRPFQARAEEDIEDEAAEAAELCRMLMDDDEDDRKKKKKKKVIVVGEQLGPNHVERVQKVKNVIKRNKQPNSLPQSMENVGRDQKEEDNLSAKRDLSGKPKTKKKVDIEAAELFTKKVIIVGDNLKQNLKEKKSARESFVCGACGQSGHMRTNKNCPKYGEDLEASRVENADSERPSGKLNTSDQVDQPLQKTSIKKIIQKSATKIALVEAPPEDDKSTPKAKILKVKCGRTDKLAEKLTPATSISSDKPSTSDADTGSKAVKKITFSNKAKPEVMLGDSHRPPNIFRPSTEFELGESHRPPNVFRPSTEFDKEQPRRKIIIKQPKENIYKPPKEIFNVDDLSQEGDIGFEYRKTKRLMELSTLDVRREKKYKQSSEHAISKKNREDRRWVEEEEKRRIADRQREERVRRLYDQRAMEEQERLAEMRNYEEVMRLEREEEERQKAQKMKKKKKKKMKHETLDDYPPRRNDWRIPERTAKKRAVPDVGRFGAGYGPATKRRRGGEVGLANILERVVDALKESQVSYLFVKPVTKKEAPDYHRIIERPMDLSTIKEKVRKMEYKGHDEFRHDVWQIKFNAHKYNDGRNPGIPPLADELLWLCDKLLEENRDGLLEAEAGIQHDS
ncbi:OLC1v1002717C1 [Oldenlandia corymbosa var. corymbosa]|uniref:Transcription initiation factor TFIID subunit 1 n=1 Tax=Oldenlandia corymbosa var. corymbosa TaxID=529605 RepID=A0AAV1D8B5_OLDCO|nr:OLC1v1002717C1 [Oldenlandia corymbosa var. corymbosa]